MASETFNYVCRVLVSWLHDWHVRLPETEQEWENEIKGFIENYEFPCIGAKGRVSCLREYQVEKLLQF